MECLECGEGPPLHLLWNTTTVRNTQSQPEILVISLAGATRRRAIARMLNHHGLHFSFLDAVDGQALDSQDLARLYDADRNRTYAARPLTRAEIGCAASHLQAYRRLVESNAETVVVLEDDALLGEAFARFVRNIDNVPTCVGVVSFFSSAGYVRASPSFNVEGVRCHEAPRNVSHTVGYVIRRWAADVILSENARVAVTADWPIAPRKVGFHVTLPFIVGHGAAPSQIEGERHGKKGANRKSGRLWDPGNWTSTFEVVFDHTHKRLVHFERRIAPSRFIDLSAQASPDPNEQIACESGLDESY